LTIPGKMRDVKEWDARRSWEPLAGL
jgi:hypothetical protein